MASIRYRNHRRRAPSLAFVRCCRAVVEHPFIYELNTWVWLDELSRTEGATIDLARRSRARVGQDRSARLRRRLADGRLGAQPGGDRDRARERRPDRELPARAARLSHGGRRRVAVLHSRLHGRRAPGRAGRPRSSARRARGARGRTDPRLRAEPRRARSSVDGDAPRVLRPRQRGRPRARPGLVRQSGRRSARERPRPVLPRLAGRRAAERVLARPARRRDPDARLDRRSVRRRALRHGDADDERHLRADVGRAWRSAADRRLLADGDPGGQGGASRVRLHRRGLLGPRVGAPATRFRLLLRQTALRPSRPRGRRRRCTGI